MQHSWLKIGMYSLILIILGMAAGWYASDRMNRSGTTNQPVPLRQGGFSYINPLLLCDFNAPEDTQELKSVATHISTYAESFKKNKELDRYSVYFRDLKSGRWTGINSDDTYNPASLLKLPILIAYMKKAETDPGLLSKKILYKGTDSVGLFYNLKKGTWYTVEELLAAMIEQSDNSAKDLLIDSINLDNITGIFSALGVEVKTDPQAPYIISPRNYGRFFRILYNATYDNRELSEKALSMLVKASFKDGLVAGVPQDVAVAHKFGQYTPETPGEGMNPFWEFHDCGIVYHPERPYLLCVMTKGSNFNSLESVVQGISRIVYQAVDANYKQ